MDNIEDLDSILHEAVQNVSVTHTNAFELLALVARCALHRWTTAACCLKKMFCCSMCSCVAGGCGAVKRVLGIVGDAVVAAAGNARRAAVMWCVGTVKAQSAENLQCIKQYVIA